MRAELIFIVLVCAIAGVHSSCFAQQVTVTAKVQLAGIHNDRPADSSGAVIWLNPLGSSTKTEAARGRLQLVQKHKSFSPHLLVVQVGSSVEFPNQDPFFHNVFSLFEGRRFDLGLYEAGSTRSVVFNRAGISYIFCNIHPEMSAVVIALNTSYYEVSDREGKIAIPNVPPGRYEINIWHERALPETSSGLKRTIVISDESAALGMIQLPLERNLSPAHKNKYGKDYDPAGAGAIYPRP